MSFDLKPYVVRKLRDGCWRLNIDEHKLLTSIKDHGPPVCWNMQDRPIGCIFRENGMIYAGVAGAKKYLRYNESVAPDEPERLVEIIWRNDGN